MFNNIRYLSSSNKTDYLRNIKLEDIVCIRNTRNTATNFLFQMVEKALAQLPIMTQVQRQNYNYFINTMAAMVKKYATDILN